MRRAPVTPWASILSSCRCQLTLRKQDGGKGYTNTLSNHLQIAVGSIISTFFFFPFFPSKCRNTGIGVNKCEAAGVIIDALYVGIMYVCMHAGG